MGFPYFLLFKVVIFSNFPIVADQNFEVLEIIRGVKFKELKETSERALKKRRGAWAKGTAAFNGKVQAKGFRKN